MADKNFLPYQQNCWILVVVVAVWSLRPEVVLGHHGVVTSAMATPPPDLKIFSYLGNGLCCGNSTYLMNGQFWKLTEGFQFPHGDDYYYQNQQREEGGNNIYFSENLPTTTPFDSLILATATNVFDVSNCEWILASDQCLKSVAASAADILTFASSSSLMLLVSLARFNAKLVTLLLLWLLIKQETFTFEGLKQAGLPKTHLQPCCLEAEYLASIVKVNPAKTRKM